MAAADQLETQLYWQQTDALQHTEQQRRSYSFINPIDFTTYAGTQAERSTDFEFNQEVKGLGMMLVKSFTTGAVEHSMVYGFNTDQTATERPRNRCDTAIATGVRTCAIAAYPFAAPEVFPNKTFPDTQTTRAGVYWQDEMVLGSSGFTFIPGLRYDRYEMDPSIDGLLDVSAFGFDVVPVEEDELSINLGLIYDLTDNIALFAQYAEGFRPPNFEEANQAFVNRSFSYATVPNPDLQPETSQSLELGVKANFDPAYLSMAYYDNRYKDFIDSRFIGLDSGISLFQNRNIGAARVYGAEASAVWLISDQWQLRGAVAYAHGDDKEAGVPLDTIDPLTGVLGLRYAATGNRWGVETVLTLADEKERVSADDKVTANGYGLVDLFGHYNVTNHVTLRAGVFNLLDKQYARWANIQGFDATDASAIARARETGINFRLGMNVQF
jgi:hemoglobin/transferrin/lactoferrin receptor protein